MHDHELMAPEQIDPRLLEPKVHRVLVLASYCDDDDPKCSNDFPCNECLLMCNIATATVALKDVLGGFEYMKKRGQ